MVITKSNWEEKHKIKSEKNWHERYLGELWIRYTRAKLRKKNTHFKELRYNINFFFEEFLLNF